LPAVGEIEVDSPSNGTESDLAGMFSAMSKLKTENDKSTVRPKVTFSPLSAGRKNVVKVSTDSITHGKITFSV